MKGPKSKPCLDSHPQPNTLGKTEIHLISESKAAALKEMTTTWLTWKTHLTQAYLQRGPQNAQHRLCGTQQPAPAPADAAHSPTPLPEHPLSTRAAASSTHHPHPPKHSLFYLSKLSCTLTMVFHRKSQAHHHCHSPTHAGLPLEGQPESTIHL